MMKQFFFTLFLFFIFFLSGQAFSLTPLEQGIIKETNKIRANPKKYAQFLEERLQYYDGLKLKLPGKRRVTTKEGAKAVKKAIKHLKRLKPLPPLAHAQGLSNAARDQLKDKGQKGEMGHKGSDGSKASTRISRYGEWKRGVAENISYGMDSSTEVVLQLLIDDGVKKRGHRKIMLNPIYTKTGVACGSHKAFKTMCVITYAGDFVKVKP